MKVHEAFIVPILSQSIEEWSNHKEEIISLMDLDDTGRNYYTDFYKFHQKKY